MRCLNPEANLRVCLGADEAQEVGEGEEDEIEAMFKKKKKRRVLDHMEKRKIVDNLLAQVLERCKEACPAQRVDDPAVHSQRTELSPPACHCQRHRGPSATKPRSLQGQACRGGDGAQMEVAAEMDMEENRNRRPALNKLRHLPEVEEVLALSPPFLASPKPCTLFRGPVSAHQTAPNPPLCTGRHAFASCTSSLLHGE